jgi:hypothetical protein
MNTGEIVSAVTGGSVVLSVTVAATAVRRAVSAGYSVVLTAPSLSFKPAPKPPRADASHFQADASRFQSALDEALEDAARKVVATFAPSQASPEPPGRLP